MTPKQLKSRQKFVKASPMKKISSMSKFSRREPNKIKENKEVHPNDVFDTFFDFEEDISSLKPSSEQFVMESNRESEKDDKNIADTNYTEGEFTIMKEISLKTPVIME